jgi:hypothetical protein
MRPWRHQLGRPLDRRRRSSSLDDCCDTVRRWVQRDRQKRCGHDQLEPFVAEEPYPHGGRRDNERELASLGQARADEQLRSDRLAEERDQSLSSGVAAQQTALLERPEQHDGARDRDRQSGHDRGSESPAAARPTSTPSAVGAVI